LSNRIDANDYGKIVGAISERIPVPTIEEQHEMKLPNGRQDFPGSLSGNVWTRKDAERLIGRELFEMAIRVGSLDEAWLVEIEKLHSQVWALLRQSRQH
jgi:hypothetical protein